MGENVQDRKINFCFSKPLEFLYALLAVSLAEEIAKDSEDEDIVLDEEYMSSVKAMRNKLSMYIKGELEYFFHMNVSFCGGIGQSIYINRLILNPEVGSVEDMIGIIENSTPAVLFSSVVKHLFYENRNAEIENFCDWDSVKNNMEEMLDIMRNQEFKSSQIKQKIIECLENPEETKSRYTLLLRQFYKKAYKVIEEDIYQRTIPKMNNLEMIFDKNPGKFSQDYFIKDISVFRKKLMVHVSYFRYAGSDYWTSRESIEYIAFGSDTLRFYGEKPRKEKVLNFLKAISDKNRFQIIELLSEKPWYVNEIADKMDMSAATASYHLTTLQDLNIVYFERSEHKFYYFLNKDKLKEHFDSAMKMLLHI